MFNAVWWQPDGLMRAWRGGQQAPQDTGWSSLEPSGLDPASTQEGTASSSKGQPGRSMRGSGGDEEPREREADGADLALNQAGSALKEDAGAEACALRTFLWQCCQWCFIAKNREMYKLLCLYVWTRHTSLKDPFHARLGPGHLSCLSCNDLELMY